MPTAKPDMNLVWAAAGSILKPSDSKIQEGWVAEKPPFQNENWVQNRTDQYLKHIDERGVPEWKNESEYELGALVWYQDQIWESINVDGLSLINLGNIPNNNLGFWLSQEYLDTRGGTMTGELQTTEGIRMEISGSGPAQGGIRNYDTGIKRSELIYDDATGNYSLNLYSGAGVLLNSLTLLADGTLSSNGGQVWNSNNMGTGSGLDADLLDGSHLSQIIAQIPVFRGALAILGAPQSILTGVSTDINFLVEGYDTDDIHSTVLNPQNLVVPAGVSFIRLTAYVEWIFLNNGGVRSVSMVNITAPQPGLSHNAGFYVQSLNPTPLVSSIIPATPGDIYRLNVFQDSGVTLQVQGTAGSRAATFSMEIIE